MSIKMNHTAEYRWNEIKPNVFQRSMVPLERFFNPAMGWSVWASINLSLIYNCSSEKEFIDRVRQAWIRILFEQPQLASLFDFAKGTCVYTTITEDSLAAWSKETVIISDNPYSAEALRSKPILCINPTTRELLFRSPHYYIDGIGSILLLKDLVSYISTPEIPPFIFGTEVANLSPIFEVAASIPPPSNADLERAEQLTTRFLTSRPTIGLSFHDGPSTQHSVSEICLSTQDSDALVAACKSRGLTPTHAVHAAMMQAVSQLNNIDEATWYTSIHISNWRSRLQPEFERCRGALYCGAFPMTVENPGQREFDDLAKEMKELYVGTELNRDMSKVHSQWWNGLLTIVSAAGETEPVSTPLLSSLGIIENFLPQTVNGVKIESFKFGIEIKGPVVTVYLWNWGGRLSLCAAWDRGSFEEGEIDQLLQLIVEKLALSLNLTLCST